MNPINRNLEWTCSPCKCMEPMTRFLSFYLVFVGGFFPQTHALMIAPPLEGYASLEIIETSPDLIFCVLCVSGGPKSELLAIDPKGPSIRWRAASTQRVWHAMTWDTNVVYTIEGTVLQNRRTSDGVVLGKRDLALINTPASSNRPWDSLETELAEARLQMDTMQGVERKDQLFRIEGLQEDIAFSKKEWSRSENYDANFFKEYDIQGYTFSFLPNARRTLRVARTKRRGHPFYELLFREFMDFDPKSGLLLSSTDLSSVAGENALKMPFILPEPYPHKLIVIGAIEFPKMDVESVTHNLFITAMDSKKNEVWHLILPVEIKRVPYPDETKPHNETNEASP